MKLSPIQLYVFYAVLFKYQRYTKKKVNSNTVRVKMIQRKINLSKNICLQSNVTLFKLGSVRFYVNRLMSLANVYLNRY